jgi:hypothetical protein
VPGSAMWTQQQIDEIVAALKFLPAGKLLEAKKFILTLKHEFGYDKPVDCSDVWTDVDEQDFTRASWQRLDPDSPAEADHGS